jgi:hypothetical protein
MNNTKTKISYENICDSINIIFNDIENNIKDFIYEINDIKTRNTKVTFTSTLIYSLLYTKINATKDEVVAELNELNEIMGNSKTFNRTTLYEKEIKIPLEFYVDLFNKISKLYLDFFDKNEKKIVGVDGVYNNTNVFNIKGFLETSMNLGLFDATNAIPLFLSFNGIKDKNNELVILTNYINENTEKFKNVILVLDRAYCSYNFINLLNKKQINFVCRFRNNCKNFNQIGKVNRIINFSNESNEIIINNNVETNLINNKKFSSVEIKIINDYKLITNLSRELYNDDAIKDLYHKRWDIEVFFKILKQNFKFSDLRITNNEQINNPYNIHNTKILIICMLSKIFDKTYEVVNNVKLIGEIQKRKFKNKKIKNNELPNKKKEKKKKKKDETEKIIINVDILNNKKICIKKEDDVCIHNNDEQTNDKSENKIENKIEDSVVINTRKCILKTNKSMIIKGVYKILHYIVNSKLTKKIMTSTFATYIKYKKVDTKLKNKRICKTPFKKWYIKGYTNKSDFTKIVSFILGFTPSINKNLKTLSKSITITKISYI